MASFQQWRFTPTGRHIELGIAENNLFLLLSVLGLADSLFGARLLPVGTLYDPFIKRGLDALNYACYQGARFMLVATPSGITLAPEGGAHQSISTPMIGMAQDGVRAFEPAFADELAVIMRWGFEYMQREAEPETDLAAEGDLLEDGRGGSLYLRLSTRSIEQPRRRLTELAASEITAGGYWLVPPSRGAELAIVYAGAVAPEARAAHARVAAELPGVGLLAATSPDRLAAGWRAATRARRRGIDARAHVETLLAPLHPEATLVTVLDGFPATLGWLGSVYGHRVVPLGVDHFGQSGSIPELYRAYGLDEASILEACASALLPAHRP